jgi:hypothetical protein
MSDTGPDYAQRRADETGKTYLVTKMGHAMLADAANKKLAATELGGIDKFYRPVKRRPKR